MLSIRRNTPTKIGFPENCVIIIGKRESNQQSKVLTKEAKSQHTNRNANLKIMVCNNNLFSCKF